MTLAPGKAVVLWAGGAPNCPGVTNWFVASGLQLGLNDTGGDSITLKTSGGTTLLTYAFGDATINKSFNLNPDITGTTYVLHRRRARACADPACPGPFTVAQGRIPIHLWPA